MADLIRYFDSDLDENWCTWAFVVADFDFQIYRTNSVRGKNNSVCGTVSRKLAETSVESNPASASYIAIGLPLSVFRAFASEYISRKGEAAHHTLFPHLKSLCAQKIKKRKGINFIHKCLVVLIFDNILTDLRFSSNH